MKDILAIADLSTAAYYGEMYEVGTAMTADEFMNAVESGSIVDYDGFGDLAYNHKIICNATFSCDDNEINISHRSGEYQYTLDEFFKTFGSKGFEIIWYNK